MELIVVGNGAITRPQGYLIDKFDTVIRLSGFKIKGYECLVGTKTDIHAVARIEDSPPGAKVWVANPDGLMDIPQNAVNEAYPDGYEVNEYFKESYEICKMNNHEHPTMGLLTILMAIKFGKYFYNMPITITGFNFSHVGSPKYYWDNTPNHDLTLHHNHNKERALTKMLIEGGLVKMLDKRDIISLEYYGTPKNAPCFKGAL